MIRLALLLIALIVSPAIAHDWYTGLKNKNGEDCCGGSHCFWIDTEKRNLVETDDEFILDGIWHFKKSITLPSKDGGYHACIVGTDPRCFFEPQNT